MMSADFKRKRLVTKTSSVDECSHSSLHRLFSETSISGALSLMVSETFAKAQLRLGFRYLAKSLVLYVGVLASGVPHLDLFDFSKL